jgi:hypothetical protein
MPATNTKDRPDKHDRQIAGIRELMQQGMRMVVDTRKDIRTLAAMLKATTAAQQKTDASLKALIDILRGGGNGHTNGKSKHR